MARTWLSISVELLGGRGANLWPWPGRIFAVNPSHTFWQLADAINGAFARWDRSHLSIFTLADGRIVTDEETGAESTNVHFGPVTTFLDIYKLKVGAILKPGAEFKFVFDPGDGWTHRCVIDQQKIDPLATLGIRPEEPLPYWGWGSIPDQYGRRWEDDDGEAPLPSRPSQPHPMLINQWPSQEQLPELDMENVRAAIVAQDASKLVAELTGRPINDALQQIATGAPLLLRKRSLHDEVLVVSLVNRLTWRSAIGDQELADDLVARLRGEPLRGRAIPVDIDELADMLDSDPDSSGCYLDLQTGQPVAGFQIDPAIAGEAKPERYVWLEGSALSESWDDMAAFADQQHDQQLSTRLRQAIEGKGAFRCFRDLVYEEGLGARWQIFEADRRYGRARHTLAEIGIRIA